MRCSRCGNINLDSAQYCSACKTPLNAAEYEAIFFGKLLPATSTHHSSMLQDVKRGKKTEIDSMNGIIASLGEKHGIKTPVNLILTQLVHGKEKIAGA